MKNLQSKNSGHSIHQDDCRVQVVFVHGWGMNSAVWQPFIEQLPDQYEALCIDLPGHGEFNQQDFFTLEDLTAHCQQQAEAVLSGSAIWVGWSLGALPVLQLATQHSPLIKKILVVASNPCFVSREQWGCGVEQAVFDLFADNLQNNIEKTLQRFLSLQVQGMDNAREVLRILRGAIVSRGLPSQSALNAGLDVLKNTDLRQQLNDIDVPVSWLLGEKDTLVPAALNEFLTQQGIDSRIIGGSAHLPFISHSEEVIHSLAVL